MMKKKFENVKLYWFRHNACTNVTDTRRTYIWTDTARRYGHKLVSACRLTTSQAGQYKR